MSKYDHKVLVVTDGINFRAFYKNKRMRITSIPQNKQQFARDNGNPFGIYGDLLKCWLKISKFNMNITVAKVMSDNL